MLFMFEGKLDVNVDRNTLISNSCRAGWETAVNFILEEGADISESGALEVTAGAGHKGLIDILTKAGAETDTVAAALTAAAGGG